MVDKNIKSEKSLDKLTDNYSSTGWGILPEVLFRMAVFYILKMKVKFVAVIV
ncbi:hypothetical protein J9303_20815 [Bacillaceae bacterium Marseille-Q3522]|nr:hypothetical protein [Bacillaceae bacterium Marseille-Q3522]